MCDEKKKVLFVIGMDYKIEHVIKQTININPDNIMVLQRYEPIILPFGDLMRDIIIAVYQENVEEIFVVATKDNQTNTGDILNIIYKNKELQEKIQTLDYLFKTCKPEFPEGSITEWLEGSNTSTDGMQNMVSVIRHHPLMPSHVRVKELFTSNENEKQSEIEVV